MASNEQSLLHLFNNYKFAVTVVGLDQVHDKMWAAYGWSDCPGYNVFSCLMHTLETATKHTFVAEANTWNIFYCDGTKVDIEPVARHMANALVDLTNGLNLACVHEW